ncbi:nuclear transcription factor Y subunit beta-like isoform X4 [Colias croceus]|uniref:nuclear transcription factor Y subunit beta-like isoform X4 n=1 Tax=Colias crocea TaxID=72248 RepID=UPI001E280A6A|nr:nuclear transcription factor Y subunit beta-like isoform X4 [Colias croceus]
MRTSHPQYTIMVEFMEKHGDLSKPSGGPRGRHYVQQKWKELIDMLNSDGTGDSRTEEKWRKVVGGEDVSLSGVQVPATETVDELTVDYAAYEYTPIPEDEWNTAGTSSQPTVAPPLPPPTPPTALTPPPGPVQTQWQPPKKKKKPEDLVIKVFKECERNAREYEKERDRIAQELERERIRQRDVELQLQAQWLDFMREALKVVNKYLEKRSE